MADFPAKVSTETSSPPPQGGGDRIQAMASRYVTMDMDFLRTIPAGLMLVEIVLGLLVWALIAASGYANVPAYGWVMFVSVIFWLLTLFLFFVLFFGVRNKLGFLPWPLMLLVFNATATILYLSAFLANAASVYNSHQGAAAFFAIVVTLAYGASTFFAFLSWRGDGSNAASSTVPA
ncbi:plasmolipin [Anguilla rostrata]|uniref:plasmolipin n=1 Tax=Anguilla rostrata TaxID=7938 RepID=UPI0030CDD8FA